MTGAKPRSMAAVFVIGGVIWFAPHPQGVETQAWHLFTVLVATVVAIMLRPLPMGAMAIIGLTTAVITRTLTIEDALGGFGNRVIWLIAVAFFVARAFIKTGLGSRIAYLCMRAMGRRTLGLGYSLVAADLILAPVIPSNTARAGGGPLPHLDVPGQGLWQPEPCADVSARFGVQDGAGRNAGRQ